jgi:hypothetical protein
VVLIQQLPVARKSSATKNNGEAAELDGTYKKAKLDEIYHVSVANSSIDHGSCSVVLYHDIYDYRGKFIWSPFSSTKK